MLTIRTVLAVAFTVFTNMDRSESAHLPLTVLLVFTIGVSAFASAWMLPCKPGRALRTAVADAQRFAVATDYSMDICRLQSSVLFVLAWGTVCLVFANIIDNREDSGAILAFCAPRCVTRTRPL